MTGDAHDPEAEALWRGLTAAQREAVLWLPQRGHQVKRGKGDPSGTVLRGSALRGIVGWHCGDTYWLLRGLGRRVRAAGLRMEGR